MKTSMDIIIRHDCVFTWNFSILQKCPLFFVSNNRCLKEIVKLYGAGSGKFFTTKLEKIINKEEIKSECLKHYRP